MQCVGYPSDAELQAKLQESVDWNQYKTQLMASVVAGRQQPGSNLVAFGGVQTDRGLSRGPSRGLSPGRERLETPIVGIKNLFLEFFGKMFI